ncbi:MAG: HD domain-containing protein [Nanoarchaeota archaeon]|nr:HD domain-containing protein [Nanoarchaeota archaeon]
MELVKEAETFFKENIPESRDSYVTHVSLVRRYAMMLATEYDADPVVVEVAALLHDVGADAGPVHAQKSAEMVEGFLSGLGVEDKLKKRILSAIRNHSMSKEGGLWVEDVPIEDQVIRDADAIAFLKDEFRHFYKRKMESCSAADAKKYIIKEVKGMLTKVKTEKGLELAKKLQKEALEEIKAF